MADFTIVNLTTAVSGFNTITRFIATQKSYSVDTQQPISINRDLSFTETRPGWLTGRRPSQGQLFPRGVYNK